MTIKARVKQNKGTSDEINEIKTSSWLHVPAPPDAGLDAGPGHAEIP